MKNQRKTYTTLFLAIAGTVIFILFLLFIPDMSTTLINTVPEHPPELGIVDTNQTLITSAVTIDKENVKSIISAMARPEEYFSETQSILSHESGSATYTRRRWVKGSLSRVDLISSSQTMHYVYTSDKLYVWRSGSRTYHTASRGEFEPDDAQMMMSYEDILNADDKNIVSANLTTYDSTPCIYAELKSPHTGYTERYWVSATTGLLLHGETLDTSSSVIYSITATQTDISEQISDNFKLPDGKIPE